MDSAVKSRPNHYELLGLAHGASAEEIAQAYAKELGLLRPRAFGSLAEVTVAYETLRDPAKRKAYDAGIGVESPSEPVQKPALSLAGRLEGAHFPPMNPSPPAPRATRRPKAEWRIEPRTAPSATALLHQPIKPAATKTGGLPPRKPVERPRPESRDKIDRPRGTQDRAAESRRASIDWKLPALAAGALAVAIGGGAWTGWEAGNDAEQAAAAVTLKVPPAKAASAVPAPESAPAATNPAPVEQARRDAPALLAEPSPLALQAAAPVEPQTELAALEQKQRELEAESAPAQPAPVETVAAKLPLPDAVVAQTIARIGYPCGEVASTTAMGGAGVFKVTCTSGHSYRAAPVRGRYHFRRMAGR
jgi:hypothetical protein